MINITNIPEERKIKFLLDGTDVFEHLKKDMSNLVTPVNLIYTDDTTLELNSKFSNLLNIKGSNLLTLLSGATGGVVPSGQFGIQGIQVWEETDPIEFSLSVELHMGKNGGKTDVVIPALALSKLTLPSYKGGDNKKGMSLIPPGPDLKDVLKLVGSSIGINDLFGNGRDKKSANQGGGLLTVQIGKFLTISNIILTKVEPTFSSILDEDGMPIHCKLLIECRTVEVATTYMITQIINNIK